YRLVKHHDAMPFGALLAFAGRPVIPGLARSQREADDLAARLCAVGFRVLAEIADKDDLVDRTCHVTVSLFSPREGIWLVPSASSGVWPLGTGRRSGTTACAARDRMPRAEPRSGGPQAEHGEDPPVDVIRRRVQAAATPEEDATARPESFPISFLILPPHYFRSHLQSHRACGVGPLIDARGRLRSELYTRNGPNPARVRPSVR